MESILSHLNENIINMDILNKKKAEQVSLDEDRENIISYIIKDDKNRWIDKHVREIKREKGLSFY